jgi:hypothetical protein
MQKNTIMNDEERKKRMEPDYSGLWDTQDIVALTGWGRTYISGLCSKGVLPYIPGRPNKFIPSSVRSALEKMQIGGQYGRRKPKKPLAKQAA